MSDYKISIIIPCYNVKKTIEACVESVINQTIKFKEIICINYGSTDETLDLLYCIKKKYESYTDATMVIVDQKNSDASTARNKGIEIANGEFVSFLDTDDIYDDVAALQMMVDAAKEYNKDICGALMRMNREGVEYNYDLYESIPIQGYPKVINYSEYQNACYYQSYVFRRDFLYENSLMFPLYKCYQDSPFLVRAMSFAKELVVVPKVLCVYTDVGTKTSTFQRNVQDLLNGILDVLLLAKENDYKKLFSFTINSIENYYYEAISTTLSDDSLELLISINRLSVEFIGKSISILYEFYNKSKMTANSISVSHNLLEKYVAIKQSNIGFSKYFHEHNINRVVVYGVGAYGKRLIDELIFLGVEIVCAIDRNVLFYKNVIVQRPEDEIPECDCVIVSMIACESVIDMIKDKTKVPILLFKKIIEEAFIDSLAEKKCEIKPYLEYLVVNILDHCNLRCKGCDHFACVADEYFVSLNTIKNDVVRMSKLFSGKNIMQIAVMGGEPLLHPQLLDILLVIRKCFPHSVIRLTTNGILLLSQTSDFWRTCRESDITIVNTRYPLKTKYEDIEKKAKDEGVKFRYFEGTGEGYIKKSFKKHINLEKNSDIEKEFLRCHISNYGNFLMEGKLYGCPFSCQSYRIFAKKYNVKMEMDQSDYIDIYEIDSKEDIYEFAARPKKYCGYCQGKTEMFTWDRTSGDISEWI